MPLLTHGLGDAAKGSACVMSAAAYLTGHPEQGDAPECINPVLRRVFVSVNDAPIWESDEHRTRVLTPLMFAAMGTTLTGTDHEQKVLSVRLVVWSARRVLPLVRESDRAVCEAAIQAAEGWCEGTVTQEECRAADAVAFAAALLGPATYAAVYAASAVADAVAYADAASAVADAATYAADAATYAATYAASAVADAVYAASAVADAAYAARLDFLTDLITEHARLTNHQPTPVPQDRWDSLCALVPVVTR